VTAQLAALHVQVAEQIVQSLQDAHEMLRALLGDEELVQPRLESLAGKTVAFTGPLSIRRFDAEVMVMQAGGSVDRHVTGRVDVIVQGRRSPAYRDGHKGDKLARVEKLLSKGREICIINEDRFKELVGL
jgi:NAD-dependent DNA ligase